MPRSQRMAAEIPICAQTTIKVVQNSTYKWVNNLFVRVLSDIYTLTTCCSVLYYILYVSFPKSSD